MTHAASLGILPARPRKGCYPTPGGRWPTVWRSKAALPQDTAAANRADASRPGHPGLQGWGKQGAGRRTLGLSQQMAPGSLRPAAPREAGELASCRARLARPVLSALSQQETDRDAPAQSGGVNRGPLPGHGGSQSPVKGGQDRFSSATAAAGGGEPGGPEPCSPRQGRRLRKAGRPKGRARSRAGAVRPGHPGALTGRARGTLWTGGRGAPGARGPEGRP